MQATPEMLEYIKLAVKHMEESWDAQRDFELEVGGDFNGLNDYIQDLAVMGAESVDLEMVQAYLDEFLDTAIPFRLGPFGGTKGADNGKK